MFRVSCKLEDDVVPKEVKNKEMYSVLCGIGGVFVINVRLGSADNRDDSGNGVGASEGLDFVMVGNDGAEDG